MRVQMAIFGPIILWSYVITILIFVKRWKSLGFWLLEAAFGLFITDVLLRSFKLQSIVTLRNLISIMLPLNKQKWWVKCPTKSSRTSVIRSGFLPWVLCWWQRVLCLKINCIGVGFTVKHLKIIMEP